MKNFGKKTIVAETAAKNETAAEEKEYVFALDGRFYVFGNGRGDDG